MKNNQSALALSMVIGFSLFNQSILAQETNQINTNRIAVCSIPVMPPLPKQFDGMTAEDVFPGLYPVAIYRYRSGKLSSEVNYVCAGILYQTDTNSYEMVLPRHLFSKEIGEGSGFAYGVRTVRPDSGAIVGFLDHIVEPNTGNSIGSDKNDIVTVSLGTVPRVFKGTNDIEHETVSIIPAATVSITGKEIKSLRSLVTGKEVKIIGYGVRISEEIAEFLQRKENKGSVIGMENKHPYILIEMEAGKGYSGISFKDEYGRVFIVHGGLDPKDSKDSSGLQKANDFFREKYGRNPIGITVLTGTLEFDIEKE